MARTSSCQNRRLDPHSPQAPPRQNWRRLARRPAFQPAVERLESRELLDAAGLFRSLDGTGNNLAHPEWGSTDEQLLRKAAAEYGDGLSTPAGAARPSARDISNTIVAHSPDETPNDRDLTAYIYVWGQFLDHDMDLTTSASPAESFPILVPQGDDQFDPDDTGTQTIPLSRSIYDPSTGRIVVDPRTNVAKKVPREQLNQITAWIDGSMIYGSDAVRAAALHAPGGKLAVTSTAVGDLPPLNTAGFANANDAHRAPDNQLFLAGDVRSNENIELTAMHTLFIREHNFQATRIAAANPGLGDEQIYQQARAIVIGEIQSITYNEWLPAVLGSNALKPYRGYDRSVNPGIANEFSTAAFRLHTTINNDVEFFDNNGRPITFDYVDDYGEAVTVEGEVALSDAFFNPTLLKASGVDGILKYAASTHMEEMDNQLAESLRNFLFGQPGQGGLDLAALNIQRGRDHGLADYNDVRAAYGLPKLTRFSQISSDPAVVQALQQLYGDPTRADKGLGNIDLWVGAMAEDHVRGTSVGPLVQRIMVDQFQRLRDGDRFWYERAFSGSQLRQLQRTQLSDIIERNTGVAGLQDNVFVFRAEVSGQVYFDRDGSGEQNSRSEIGVPGILVQLINDEGDVIDSTLTGRGGRYRFRSFPETGDFAVRIVVPTKLTVTTENPLEFLISTGDQTVRGKDFGIRLAGGGGSGLVATSTNSTTGAPASAPTDGLGLSWDNCAASADAIRRYWEALGFRVKSSLADDGA